MQYQATRRIQIRCAPLNEPNELVYHEARDDGMARCGQTNRDWRGRPSICVPVKAGPVTCEKCAR